MRKIKKHLVIPFVYLIAIILCSSCGYIENNFLNQKELKEYYECTITFHVNPEEPKDTVGENGGSQYGVYGAYGRHVMDNMVKLLSSEKFAEILMEDMEDVPVKNVIDVATGNEVISSEYISMLYKVHNAVSFSYLEASADYDDANNLLRSNIYATISVAVEEGQEFANNLLQQVKKKVPLYVEENMAVPTDYTGTNCEITESEEFKIIKK